MANELTNTNETTEQNTNKNSGQDTVDLKELGAIVPMLKDMSELSDILKRMRRRRGAINFDFPETKVILNDDGSVRDIMPYPINFCHGIIESFMICANEFVAESYASLNYPFVYRVHEDPDPIKIARFASVAKNFGATGRLSGKITPLMVCNFMSTLKDESASKALDTLLLRSMAKARYSSQNLGHFGLASKFYCHLNQFLSLSVGFFVMLFRFHQNTYLSYYI